MSKRDESLLNDHYSSQSEESTPKSLATMSSASTQAIASIGSYCLANMAMTVTNKYVFSVRTPTSIYVVNGMLTSICRAPSSICIVPPISIRRKAVLTEFVVMLLALQSVVCLLSLLVAKNSRVISFRDFNADEAKKCTSRHLSF